MEERIVISDNCSMGRCSIFFSDIVSSAIVCRVSVVSLNRLGASNRTSASIGNLLVTTHRAIIMHVCVVVLHVNSYVIMLEHNMHFTCINV